MLLRPELHESPNGPDHIHIVIFVLCLHGPNYFVATFALECSTDTLLASVLIRLPLFELTRVLVRSRSRCPQNRKCESQQGVSDCETARIQGSNGSWPNQFHHLGGCAGETCGFGRLGNETSGT
jgi:hypothetical protein